MFRLNWDLEPHPLALGAATVSLVIVDNPLQCITPTSSVDLGSSPPTSHSTLRHSMLNLDLFH